MAQWSIANMMELAVSGLVNSTKDLQYTTTSNTKYSNTNTNKKITVDRDIVEYC